jgi:N-acetyl-S-(2-succino)cysteine monooxygenase
VVFTAQANLEDALLFANRIRVRARAIRGAQAEPPLILPGVMPFIGRTRAEAQAKLDRLHELIDPVVGLSLLEGLMPGIELSSLPLDGPVPEPAAGGWSRQELLARTAHDEGLTVRQLVYRTAAGRGHRLAIGTAASVADELEHWFRTGAADGFNLIPHSLPAALGDIASELVPELQRRGLFRTDFEAATLRGHLELPDAAPPGVRATPAQGESSCS